MPIDSLSDGYPMLALAVLLGALGAPIPLTAVLAASGALARQGHLQLSLLYVLCVASATLGDNLGYVIGRYGLRSLPLRIPWPRKARPVPRPRRYSVALGQLAALLGPRTDLGLLIFVTRWGITTLATPINLLAGYRRYRWRRFALLDLLGESLWVALSLLPGYALGATWHAAPLIAALLAVSMALILPLACRLAFRGHPIVAAIIGPAAPADRRERAA